MPRTKAKTIETVLAEYRLAGNSPAEVAALATILTARSEAGLTQQQVAERMQTTQSTVARIESNLARGKYPTMTTMVKYAQALGKTLEVRFI